MGLRGGEEVGGRDREVVAIKGEGEASLGKRGRFTGVCGGRRTDQFWRRGVVGGWTGGVVDDKGGAGVGDSKL